VLPTGIGGPGGDYTVTVTGNAQWKETITVNKESAKGTHHEATATEEYSFEVRARQNN
jgi:hypothetical protein